MKNLFILFALLCSTAVFGQELEKLSRQEFADRAIEKAKDLGSYISTISNKSTSREDATDAIKLALDLFYKDGTESYMQVSSTNRSDVKSYLIPDYLRRLKLMKYSKVEIQWYDVSETTELIKQPDGTYTGSITIYQKFKGYQEGVLVYEDITKKTINVVLEQIDINSGGKTEKVWSVFLNDIGVEQTW